MGRESWNLLRDRLALSFPHQYSPILAYISIIKFQAGDLRTMQPEPTPLLRPGKIASTHQALSECKKTEQSEGQLSINLPEQVITSTYLSELIKADIKLSEVYALQSKIIQGNLISENMRARIRSFLMSQASKQWVMRETLALACTYVDLYFKNKGFCEVKDFQNLAISALILAMKVQEGKFPTISYTVFSKEELLIWQRRLAKRLQYFLTPKTYINMQWLNVTNEHPQYRSLIQEPSRGPNLLLRALYEQLDCVFMVLKSLSWPLQTLVLNLFYLHVRAVNVPSLLKPSVLTKEQFIKIYYARDEFRIFFQKFLGKYSSPSKFQLNEDLGGYLMLFLGFEASLKEFPIKKNLDTLRLWDKLQTFPKECYALSKSIIEKLK